MDAQKKSRNRLSGAIDGQNVRRYIFKLHPTAEQAAILHEWRYMMAHLWNALKQRSEDTYSHLSQREGNGCACCGWRKTQQVCAVCGGERRKSTCTRCASPKAKAICAECRENRYPKHLSFFDFTNEITGLRHGCPEWETIPAVTAHRIAKHLSDAFQAFFRRLENGEKQPGYPEWKSARNSTTVPLGTMDKTGWHFERCQGNARNWRLYVKGICDRTDESTWIHARGKLPGEVVDASQAWRNADIICRDGAWWLSICVLMRPRRTSGRIPLIVRFGELGMLAEVNGTPETPQALINAQLLDLTLDTLKSRRDLRWPRNHKRDDVEQCAYIEVCGKIRRLETKIRRQRRDALHVWSAGIVARASCLTIELPKIKEHTTTPHGDQRQWGANVADVSALNRDTLSYAPASVAAMLQYKAKEAGIPCEIKTLENPEIQIGRDLVASGQQLRKSRRKIKNAEVEIAA